MRPCVLLLRCIRSFFFESYYSQSVQKAFVVVTLGGRGCWFKIKNSSYKKNSYQFSLFTVGVIKRNIFYNVGFDAKYYLLTFVS